MNTPSKLINEAVEQMASLPGIGNRTALRLTLHLLTRKPQEVEQFSNAFTRLRNEIKFCTNCYNISDTDLCGICSSPKRDSKTICVVEDIRDVMAIESTHQYFGVYHVLGGIISPMDGIGPKDIRINELVSRVNKGEVQEIILALSTTMEGDTTNFYIYRKLASYNISITELARGVSMGNELEYADELTLGRSILNRTPYELTLSK